MIKHNLQHVSKLRIDTRLREQMDDHLVLIQRLGGTIANMHDRAGEINAADVREQAIRDAMAKKGSQL